MFLLCSIYRFSQRGASRYVRARKQNPEQPSLCLALLVFPTRPQRILSGEVGSIRLPECVCRNARSLATDECTCTQNVCACCSLVSGFGDLHLWCVSWVFPAVNGGKKWSKVRLSQLFDPDAKRTLAGKRTGESHKPKCQRSKWFDPQLQKCCTVSRWFSQQTVCGPPRIDSPSNQE